RPSSTYEEVPHGCRENHRAGRQLQDVDRRRRQTGSAAGPGIAAQHPRRRHRLDRDPPREPRRVPRPRPRRLPDRGDGRRVIADATEGETREVSRDEARKLVDEGAQLIDVRADHEWEVGRIAGAAHVPLPELPRRLEEIDKDRPVVVYCRGGNRSTMATDALTNAG